MDLSPFHLMKTGRWFFTLGTPDLLQSYLNPNWRDTYSTGFQIVWSSFLAEQQKLLTL